MAGPDGGDSLRPFVDYWEKEQKKPPSEMSSTFFMGMVMFVCMAMGVLIMMGMLIAHGQRIAKLEQTVRELDTQVQNLDRYLYSERENVVAFEQVALARLRRIEELIDNQNQRGLAPIGEIAP